MLHELTYYLYIGMSVFRGQSSTDATIKVFDLRRQVSHDTLLMTPISLTRPLRLSLLDSLSLIPPLWHALLDSLPLIPPLRHSSLFDSLCLAHPRWHSLFSFFCRDSFDAHISDHGTPWVHMAPHDSLFLTLPLRYSLSKPPSLTMHLRHSLFGTLLLAHFFFLI